MLIRWILILTCLELHDNCCYFRQDTSAYFKIFGNSLFRKDLLMVSVTKSACIFTLDFSIYADIPPYTEHLKWSQLIISWCTTSLIISLKIMLSLVWKHSLIRLMLKISLKLSSWLLKFSKCLPKVVPSLNLRSDLIFYKKFYEKND